LFEVSEEAKEAFNRHVAELIGGLLATIVPCFGIMNPFQGGSLICHFF